MAENNNDNLSAQLEALLFIHGETLTLKKLAQITGAEEPAIKAGLDRLAEKYAGEHSGLKLISSGDRVQLATKPEFGKLLEKLLKEELNEALTPAALETMAIIAYAGPIARSMIDYVRGVNSTFILRTLLLRGLIERSVDPAKANVYLYRPSFDCIKYLGVAKVEDLPEYQRFREVIENIKS